MREISVNEMRPIGIGQAENAEAGTGCTVFVCPGGMRAGLDVRGGGPASRESELLKPMAAAQEIHAIVLAGGSVYAVSFGDVEADQDLVGALAAEVTAEAILRAVRSAESAYGFPAARDLCLG